MSSSEHILPKSIILESKFKYIDKIIHISDVHIRKYEKHDLYRIVFRRLCNSINDILNKHPKTIIVITGDTMHDKTHLVPESISLLKELLCMLSSLTEVVIIIGNHDVNIFNYKSLDCISPILRDLNTTNKIHLLDQDNLYYYGNHAKSNLVFGVTTIWAKEVTKIHQRKKHNKIYCGLYHGMISGCTLDNGIKATNSADFNLGDFAHYDMVMLGDIHKHQYLNSDRTVAYAGSLIQQKRDEDALDHGYILWDLSSKTSTFHRVLSDCAMIELFIPRNNKMIKSYIKSIHTDKIYQGYYLSELPTRLDVKIQYVSSTARKKFNNIYSAVSTTHQIIRSMEVLSSKQFNNEKNSKKAVKIRKVQSESDKSTESTESTESIDLDDEDSLNSADWYNMISSQNQAESTGNLYTLCVKTKLEPHLTDTTRKKKLKNSTKNSVHTVGIYDNETVASIMMDYYDKCVLNDSSKNNKTNSVIPSSSTRKLVRKNIISLLKRTDHNFENTTKRVNLISLEFNNMFCYFEENNINFEKFSGIMGLTAANYQGKSSFIDVILYAIYGKCSRGKRFDVLNINKDRMMSRIVLEVNGIQYIILRAARIKSRKARNIDEALTVWENGKNITKDDRVKTDKLIANKICSYYDMLNSSFVLQKNGVSFVDLSERQKRDLLCKMARLDVFDNILQEAKSKYLSVCQSVSRNVGKIKSYHKYLDQGKKSVHYARKKRKANQDINRELCTIRRAIRRKSKHISRQIELVESKISFNRSRLEHVQKTMQDLEASQRHTEHIKGIVEEYDELCNVIFTNQTKFVSIIDWFYSHSHDKNQIRSTVELQSELNDVVSGFNLKINKLQSKITVLTNRIIRTDCVYSAADSAGFQEELLLLSNRKDELTQTIHNLTERQAEFEILPKLLLCIGSVKSTIQQKRSKLNKTSNKIKSLTKQISEHQQILSDLSNHSYNENCSACMSNSITKKILHYQSHVDALKKKLTHFQNIQTIITGKLQKLCTVSYGNTTYDYDDLSEEINAKLQDEQSVKSELSLNQRELELVKSKIHIINNKLQSIYNQSKYQTQNQKLRKKIKSVQKSITNLTAQHNMIKQDLRNEIMSTQRTEDMFCKVCDTLELAESRLRSLEKSYGNIELLRLDLLESERYSETLHILRDEILTIKKSIKIKTKKLRKLHKLQQKVCTDQKLFRAISEDIERDSKQKDILFIIKKILDKKGLVDTFLSGKILPYLQNKINHILRSVGHYTIHLQYKSGSIDIHRSNGLSITMSSGYESYLLDLVFRLALVQINTSIRTNFLVIDEGFNACDTNSKHNVRRLLEYMKNHYEWILVVSHDEFIKSFYDDDISIKRTEQKIGKTNRAITGSELRNVRMKNTNKICKN